MFTVFSCCGMRFLSLMLLFNLIDITILCPQFMIDARVSNIKISIVMGRILKCFLVQFALFMLAGTASSQVLLSGVFHETGVGYDGQWQQLGGPGIPFDVVVYENEIQYGSFKGVRRGNANVHGFAGRRYNIVNSDGEVKTHYIVVADNGAIIRVLEVTVDSGPVPGFGFSVGYTSVMAYMTARGYPGQYDNNGGSYSNNSGSYNSNNSGNYNSNSAPRQRWVTCTLCNGTGVWKKVYAPRYNGKSSSVWCDICKGYDHTHYHETCSSCSGKGSYMRSY